MGGWLFTEIELKNWNMFICSHISPIHPRTKVKCFPPTCLQTNSAMALSKQIFTSEHWTIGYSIDRQQITCIRCNMSLLRTSFARWFRILAGPSKCMCSFVSLWYILIQCFSWSHWWAATQWDQNMCSDS
jgi:hypothetical protein